MNLEKRVQGIQDAKRMTVGEVLSYLKISAPMWSMIRARERDPTGKAGRSPSIKTIRRIEQAEREEGLSDFGERFAARSGIIEKPGEYVTKNQTAEIRRDLREMKKDLAALDRRVDAMLKRIE